MKSKQELKQFFENGDKPNQEQFWELIESYLHRDEPISLDELSALKSNLATIDKTTDNIETLGNVDTKEQVNAKINFAINALKANAPETYDTLKEIADYIANDSNAEVALLQLINTKLDKPIMTNGYYGLWDDTNKKFIDGQIVHKINTGKSWTSVGIGKTNYFNGGDDRSSALLRLTGYNSSSQQIPLINLGGTHSAEPSILPPSSLFTGDIIGGYSNLYYFTGGVDGINYKKLTGFQPDGTLPKINGKYDFNALYNHQNDKYQGNSVLTTGYQYYQKLIERSPDAIGIHNDMKSGTLFTFNFWEGDSQLYLDGYNLYFRKGTAPWFRTIAEKLNTTTTLSEKLDAKKGISSKDMSFNLQSSITPTPNTLIPSIDGSELNWFDNSSIKSKLIIEKINTTTVLTQKLSTERLKLNSYTKPQRDTLTNKEVGEMIWQTDSGNSGIRVFDGTNWLALQTTID